MLLYFDLRLLLSENTGDNCFVTEGRLEMSVVKSMVYKHFKTSMSTAPFFVGDDDGGGGGDG